MRLETFFEKFELLADAPKSVPKLREMILQLAVQGRLVPQETSEDSTNHLPQRIKQAALSRTAKKQPSLISPQLPFSVPSTWRIVSLGDVCVESFYGPRFGKEEYSSSGIPTIRTTDMTEKGEIILKNPPCVRVPEEKLSLYRLEEDDLLITRTGSIGTMAIFRGNYPAIPSAYLIRFRFLTDVWVDFIYYYLKSPWGKSLLGLNTNKLAQPNINATAVCNFPFPLPPLEEQHRIVAKVDELMRLCDELEARQRKQREARVFLTSAAVDQMLAAPEPTTFAQSWGRVATNFEKLFDTPDSIGKLRQAVLQLAVQGRLVPQDPNDEPASVLLERIKKERSNKTKGRAVKQQTLFASSEPKVSEQVLPIPSGWVWTRLSEMGEINPRNSTDDDVEVSFVPMSLISQFYGEPVEFEIKPWSEVKKGYTHFAEGDVVLAKITPCFQNGKSAVMRQLKNGFGAGTTELHVFRPIPESIVPEFALIFLKSPEFIRNGVPVMTGTAGQQRIPNDYFSECPFPLPPLTEQHRIVAKVDELMRLCDQLEAQLTHAQERSVALMDIAARQVLAAVASGQV